MFPWAAIIGLAGQAVSGFASAINNKRMQQSADAEAARQEAFYKAQASQDPLSRSENRSLLGQYDRDAKKQVETARNVAAITGATPEYSLGVQKAVAEGRANLMSNMSAGASRRADYYNTLGEETRHRKALEDQQRRAERNQTYANLAANAATAAGSIMDAYSAKLPSAGQQTLPDTLAPTTEAAKAAQVSDYQQQTQDKKKLQTGTGVLPVVPEPLYG